MSARDELLAQLEAVLPEAVATLERLAAGSRSPRIRAQAAALLALHRDHRGPGGEL
jgi:hypothetical protein